VDVTGRGFPRGKLVRIVWSLSSGAVVVRTNRAGDLTATLAILVPDVMGPREAVAEGYRVEAGFLVVPGSSQPGGSDAEPIYRSEGP
jgi:hypothetical protein